MNQRSYLLFPLIVLALLIAIPLLCCATIQGINTKFPSSPYLTEFLEVKPETSLQGTYYRIDYINQDLILKNTLTRATTTIIERYNPVVLPPTSYQLLRSNDHIYLIIRLASAGNSSALWFKVFDLSVSPARDLTAESDDPNMGQSCTYPVLVENSLKFEIAPDCSASAQNASSGSQTYWLDLRVSPSPTSSPAW